LILKEMSTYTPIDNLSKGIPKAVRTTLVPNCKSRVIYQSEIPLLLPDGYQLTPYGELRQAGELIMAFHAGSGKTHLITRSEAHSALTPPTHPFDGGTASARSNHPSPRETLPLDAIEALLKLRIIEPAQNDIG
jgi:hypothetical protein